MSAELAPLGIKVTQLEPGWLNTRFLAKWVEAEHAIADHDETAGATLDGLKDLPPEAVADVSRGQRRDRRPDRAARDREPRLEIPADPR
jgi:NAD(P)-dependent dehydrogenase (short-subunit alcohol dehydrogenase family)